MPAQLLILRLIFFLTGVFATLTCVAGQFSDSTKQSGNTDSAQAAAWNKAAYDMVDEHTDSALLLAEKALKIAQKENIRSLEADCYKTMGAAYDDKGNMDSCLICLNNSLSIFKVLNNVTKQSNVLSDIALAYFARGIYPLALKFHMESLDLRKQLNDSSLIAKSYNNIGLVYKSKKDYVNAIRYYLLSLQLKTILKDEHGQVNTNMNLGSMYQQLQKYDSSYFYADRSYELAVKLHSDADIAGALSNKALALQSMKKYDESFPLFERSLSIALQSGCTSCLYSIYEGLGTHYSYKADYNKALQYYFKGLQTAKTVKKEIAIQTFFDLISGVYRKQNDLGNALAYKDSADMIGEKLLNEENLRQVNEMTAVYQSAEKEKQIQKLNIESETNAAMALQRSRERNYFIVASVALLILAVIIFRALKRNQQQKKMLQEQKRVIERSSVEKDVLMKEIHHRVKNNLQIISSLLNLQSGYIKDEEALNAVRDSRNRVQSMALIHKNLYHENNLTGINIDEYIGSLCDNLLVSYHREDRTVNIVKDIQPLILDVETVIPMGLILNELITNSLKYAFVQQPKGVIKVTVKLENNNLCMNVFDNGVGFKEPGQATTQSFGLRMIKAFLQKMNGTMDMYNEDGARTEIRIKDYKIQPS